MVSQSGKRVSLKSTLLRGDEVLAEADSTWALVSVATISRISSVTEADLDRFLAHYRAPASGWTGSLEP